MLAYIFAIFGVLMLKISAFKKFADKEEYMVVIGGLSVVLALALSFSKILARKFPFNCIIYLLVISSFGIATAGVAKEYKVFYTLAFLIFQGF